jgi:hypothetical protein
MIYCQLCNKRERCIPYSGLIPQRISCFLLTYDYSLLSSTCTDFVHLALLTHKCYKSEKYYQVVNSS